MLILSGLGSRARVGLIGISAVRKLYRTLDISISHSRGPERVQRKVVPRDGEHLQRRDAREQLRDIGDLSRAKKCSQIDRPTISFFPARKKLSVGGNEQNI